MQTPVSLKSVERKAFQTTFADGLLDVHIGCLLLIFAIAPLLSQSLGDFWSSVIFLPFWGLIYLAIWLVRKHIIAPRLGTVNFGKARQQKMHRFKLLMVGFNALVFILGLLAFLNISLLPSIGFIGLLSLFLLAGFSLAAYLLDYPRLYVYGFLLFVAPLVGEWLYANHGFAHHGFPVVFGVAAGIIILTGLVNFVCVLVNNPAVAGEEA